MYAPILLLAAALTSVMATTPLLQDSTSYRTPIPSASPYLNTSMSRTTRSTFNPLNTDTPHTTHSTISTPVSLSTEETTTRRGSHSAEETTTRHGSPSPEETTTRRGSPSSEETTTRRGSPSPEETTTRPASSKTTLLTQNPGDLVTSVAVIDGKTTTFIASPAKTSSPSGAVSLIPTNGSAIPKAGLEVILAAALGLVWLL